MTSRDLLEHVDDLLAPSLGQQLAFIERASAPKAKPRFMHLLNRRERFGPAPFTDIADVVLHERTTVRDLGTQPMRDQLAAAEEARAKADRVCDEIAGTAVELRRDLQRANPKGDRLAKELGEAQAKCLKLEGRIRERAARLRETGPAGPTRTYASVFDVYDAVEEVLGELADLSPEERAYAPDPQRHPRLCGRLGVAPAKEVSMRYAGAATSALIAGNIMGRTR